MNLYGPVTGKKRPYRKAGCKFMNLRVKMDQP